jgi:hypothetical protein
MSTASGAVVPFLDVGAGGPAGTALDSFRVSRPVDLDAVAAGVVVVAGDTQDL